MKTKLLTLFSLLALLLVSTAILADGRPTGLRIGRTTGSAGSTTPTVEIDVTVTGTDRYYGGGTSSVWLGATMYIYRNFTFGYVDAYQHFSSARNYYLPPAIDWGDGSVENFGPVYRSSGSGPWRNAFVHTYATPGEYMITAGAAVCCGYSLNVYSGNAIVGSTRYISTFNYGSTTTFIYSSSVVLAITNTATVRTGFGIPTLNIYGLLAMAFVLVGTGVLLFRKPQRI